jgi:EpsI family protein
LPAGLPPFRVLIAAALVVWFSVPTLLSLHDIWSTHFDYSHGHLVLVLTAILAAREIRRTPMAPSAPSWTASACLFALVLLILIGHAATTLTVAQIALPALWMAAVWALAGTTYARRVALPLIYAYFAIPIWDLLIEPMRNLTVNVVSTWIRAAGMPAFIEGNLIHVPSGTFAVEGGCAGLRYMLVAIALATFSSLLNRRRLPAALVLVGSAAVLALTGNWLRVFITVAAGLSPDGPVLQFVHNYHTPFGWILFMVFMVPLFYLDRRLQAQKLPMPVAENAFDVRTGQGMASNGRGKAAYGVCAVVAVAIALIYRIDAFDLDEPPAARVLSAPEIAGWGRDGEWRDARLPVFVGASAEVAAWYVNGTARVGAYIADYRYQRQGHEVVVPRNRPAGQSAVVLTRRPAAATTASGAMMPFQELEVADAAAERRLVWVGFRVAGNPTASDLAGKALQVEGVIRGRRDAQAFVITATCGGDCSEARSSLSKFATAAAEAVYEQTDQLRR